MQAGTNQRESRHGQLWEEARNHVCQLKVTCLFHWLSDKLPNKSTQNLSIFERELRPISHRSTQNWSDQFDQQSSTFSCAPSDSELTLPDCRNTSLSLAGLTSKVLLVRFKLQRHILGRTYSLIKQIVVDGLTTFWMRNICLGKAGKRLFGDGRQTFGENSTEQTVMTESMSHVSGQQRVQRRAKETHMLVHLCPAAA